MTENDGCLLNGIVEKLKIFYFVIFPETLSDSTIIIFDELMYPLLFIYHKGLASDNFSTLTKKPFIGNFEPVKWKCRAPLKSGKLCPRMVCFLSKEFSK